ncbi:hypothetical protein [Streptomyces sp. NPDC021224]|uniref:hypothetical protein n=1 Tax=unclassified Streptomyces TaxID=2593676 RepID=UPI0037A90E9B
MSANYPPPQQPGGQNPYGQPQPGQPQSPYGASPYAGGQPGQPAPGGFNAGAYAPPAPVGMAPQQKNPGLGVVVGVLAMIVGAFVYAGIMRALAKDDGHYTRVWYVAVAVGVLVGIAVGKVGGRNTSLPIVSAVLGVLAVFLGQFMGFAMCISHWESVASGGGGDSWTHILFSQTSDLWKFYKHEFDFVDFLFLAVAGIEGFVLARRSAS